jgi:hypothetical protein
MKWSHWLGTMLFVLSVATTESFSQGNANESGETSEKRRENFWTGSVSVSTYLAQHSRDFANPVFIADHDWLHLEARYNYEALKTGSLWLGYNFSTGKRLEINAAPMLGFVLGDTTGVAPGYTISLSYSSFEFFTQGEYLFDLGTQAGNFFYTWSEFSYSIADWLRFGLVLDRTKSFGSDFDIRRGPLLGFSRGNVDFTTYWLNPGSRNATFIFTLTVNY